MKNKNSYKIYFNILIILIMTSLVQLSIQSQLDKKTGYQSLFQFFVLIFKTMIETRIFFQNNTNFQTISLVNTISKLFRKLTFQVC